MDVDLSAHAEKGVRLPAEAALLGCSESDRSVAWRADCILQMSGETLREALASLPELRAQARAQPRA